MREALKEAEAAAATGEIPIGCVITASDGRLLARAHNLRETDHDATAHAEIVAIRRAGEALGDWHLTGCTLYVTVEPCPMCAGACVNARLARIVYGVPDYRAGACESILNIPQHPALNHHPAITAGILEQDCRALMQTFFQQRRYPDLRVSVDEVFEDADAFED